MEQLQQSSPKISGGHPHLASEAGETVSQLPSAGRARAGSLPSTYARRSRHTIDWGAISGV